MNASSFMDKQIMDLSRPSKNQDFIDLMNPQGEEQHGGDEQQHHHHESSETNNDSVNNKNKQEMLPNYDFHPIHRPALHSLSSSDHSPPRVVDSAVARDWTSLDVPSKPNPSPLRSYSSLDHVEPDKIVLEKAQKVNDSAMLSEIDRTMKKHTDALMHAIDSLSARLSQMESRTRHLEHSVDDLKLSIGNNHGSTDGKLRHLENILLEVQTGVQNIKGKQEVMEGHMQLAKFQFSKAENSSKIPNTVQQDPVPQATTASAPPQLSGFQQYGIAVPQPVASMTPPNAPPPSQLNIHPPQPMTSQFPPTTLPGPRDAYIPQPPQNSDAPRGQQYQIHPPGQHQQPPPAPQPQQYQPAPTPPYPQPPQPPQQQHQSIVGVNAPPQFQSSLGHRLDESPYVPPQTYPTSVHQPSSQPSSMPPPTQQYYGSPSPMYEPPPPSVRSNSSFYIPSSGSSEPYPYGGPTSHYGSGSSVKPQPHSPRGGTGSYPQLPTARVLPQAIPTATGISGGSGSGGSGNKVPIDDVVDKVTNMGFSRDQVRATVRRLTDNGQSVDLNVVLDKLMNDADVQPPKGWFGR